MELVIARVGYPFEDSKELRRLIREADIKLAQVGKAKNETRRFAFLACKASCKAKKKDFHFRWEEFISLVEQDVDEKAKKLAADIMGVSAKKKDTGDKDKEAKEDTKASK